MTLDNLDQTREALKIYFDTQAERERLWERAQTEDEVRAAQRADAQALIQVQEAFWRDSKHLNSRAHCAHVDIAFLRNLVRQLDAKTDREDPVG